MIEMRDEIDTASGKKLVITTIAVIIGVCLLVRGLAIAVRGTDRLLFHLIHIGTTISLCCALYAGYPWARWVTVVLFSYAGIASLLSGIRMPSSLLLLMGISYVFCSGVLLFSKSAIAFLAEQQARRQG